MKTILIITVPDTVPDPEFSILARCAYSFDEWEDVTYQEV